MSCKLSVLQLLHKAPHQPQQLQGRLHMHCMPRTRHLCPLVRDWRTSSPLLLLLLLLLLLDLRPSSAALCAASRCSKLRAPAAAAAAPAAPGTAARPCLSRANMRRLIPANFASSCPATSSMGSRQPRSSPTWAPASAPKAAAATGTCCESLRCRACWVSTPNQQDCCMPNVTHCQASTPRYIGSCKHIHRAAATAGGVLLENVHVPLHACRVVSIRACWAKQPCHSLASTHRYIGSCKHKELQQLLFCCFAQAALL
ncbi:hypothetical protein COO60DRAFT_1157238 [Scenedesmus sp. NREL 46B-D3]|nr:hypothetical protein COO60DRAFT_1157238 [Scenedesmus sp. NREL 46B-D3]